VANVLHQSGHSALGVAVHTAATSAFFHGYSAANLVAAGVATAGALVALIWLPQQPTARPDTAGARNVPAATGTPALERAQ
jgi:hypothetical protein